MVYGYGYVIITVLWLRLWLWYVIYGYVSHRFFLIQYNTKNLPKTQTHIIKVFLDSVNTKNIVMSFLKCDSFSHKMGVIGVM